MATVYLFRVDGAKDNDEFFAVARASAHHVYAGTDFRVGASGWIPDLVKLLVEEPPDNCTLTLIELEATKSEALISCRKYLPENSLNILNAFADYLGRVVRHCRTRADPREPEFARLKEILSKASHVTVTTAGALRSSATFVEESPLIDQPRIVAQPRAIHEDQADSARVFQGVLRLSQQDANALGRCVMILDAVIRHEDQSSSTLHGWRGMGRSQPLKRLLTENDADHAALRAFVLGTPNRGITLDFEKVLTELTEIWSSARGSQFNTERTRRLVSRYFAVALKIRGHARMARVFETARKHVAEETT